MKILTTLFLSFVAVHAFAAKNVLLIISDDLRTELGCYGKEHMVTPNIDRLASEGVLFKKAYVQQAVCAASRASFLSGLRPDATGADYPYSHYFVNTVMKKYPTIPRFFFENGFYTRTIGKIHHGYPHETLSEPHIDFKSKGWALEENRIAAKLPGGKRNLPPYESADVPDEWYSDGQVAQEAVKALQRVATQDQPFFFAVGFHNPHVLFNSPSKYWDLYDPETFELSPNPGFPVNAPGYAVNTSPKHGWKYEWDGRRLEQYEDTARIMRNGYYAAVSYMDAQVGKVLHELERLGLCKNTAVMFISDHGWHLGDQGKWGKTTNFENATLAPLIVSVPGLADSGKDTDSFVEYVDVFPTLVDLAGLNIPVHLEGTTIKPLLEDLDRPWKKAAFSQFHRGNRGQYEGYAIRTPRYRHVEWRDNEDGTVLTRELYDHEVDPIESKSIALDYQNTHLVENLANQLRQGWKAALPNGLSNESNTPKAPPYAWGKKRKGRRNAYINRYGAPPEGAEN